MTLWSNVFNKEHLAFKEQLCGDQKFLIAKFVCNSFTFKLLSDLYIGVHLKGTKKFGNKVINRQFFHRKTVFHMKILSIINFTTKLLSIKDYVFNGPQ